MRAVHYRGICSFAVGGGAGVRVLQRRVQSVSAASFRVGAQYLGLKGLAILIVYTIFS